MKLKYIFSFTIILITLLSMNFIFAGEVNENITLEINDDGDSIISDNYLNEDLSQKTTDNDPDSKLGNFEDGLTHVYVSPIGNGNGSSQDAPADFKTTLNSIGDNSVVHMMDGNYTWTCADKNDVISIKSKNNITIMAENSGKVMINSTSNYLSKEFNLDSSNNIIFKNIIFKGSYNADYLIYLKTCNNISIEGCSFIDFKYKSDVLASSKSSLNIRDCYFSNCSVGTNGIILQSNGEILIYNCTFDNVSKQIIKVLKQSNNFFKANISSCIFRELNGDSFIGIAGNPTVFENNTVQSSYNFELKVTGVGIINSSTTITVLDNTQLSATSGDVINITAVLVDDMGNYINIPKLDFSIDGVTYSATYKDGVYSVAYTVPEVTQPEEISFDSTPESTYLGDLTVKYQPLFLLAKPALNMTMSNVSDSVYGDNVTVKVNISNLESGNLIYQFIKDNVVVKTVTDSFSNNMSTVSVNDLPAGDYTVAVKYAEDDNFGATTITKTFTVSKANSTVQILIDPTIPVGDNITVQAVVPANAGGNVTFRLNTDNKTVNVTDKAVFDGLANGTYIIYAVYNGDDNYNPSEEVNVTFEVVKVNSTLDVEHTSIVPGENVDIIITLNKDINDNITITVNNGEPISRKLTNGTLTYTIENIALGDYNVTVNFKGNEKYLENEASTLFTVERLESNLNISTVNVDWENPVVVSVTTDERFSGDVEVSIGDKTEIAHVVNGSGEATFTNLAAKTYTVTAKLNETDVFNADEKNTTVTVNKVASELSLSNDIVFSYGSSNATTATFTGAVNITAVVLEDSNANVVVDGNVITVSGLNAGNYTLKVTASPDENHTEVSATVNITVNKIDATISLGNIIFDYGSSNSTTFTGEGIENVTATVLNQPADKVTVTGNTITVSDLDADKYTLKIIVNPDENHNGIETEVNVTVNKVKSFIDIRNEISYDYGGIGQCDVYTEGAVNFTARIVNHTEAIISISENGIVNVSGLSAGKYVLEVTTNPDKNHLSVTSSVNVTVSKVDSQITIPNIVFDYGATGNATVTVVGATGINASVLNHTEAVVNIVNNTITVSGLAAGSYVLQATTIPDGNHNPVTATANITVNGVEVPADKAISTNVPANTKSPTFNIKLEKDATGTFTVNIDNGKIVKTAELKDGAASITVADLAAGDHKISISYSGDGKYAPITQNTTLTIKAPAVVKKATKIVAKKKTFKAKVKVKKYTITLKSGKTLLKKVKVTLKVKGKTYKATTNNKGKATFKIKNLKKKGTYKAVIKFKGNKNYKASSKKVKIKVKK